MSHASETHVKDLCGFAHSHNNSKKGGYIMDYEILNVTGESPQVIDPLCASVNGACPSINGYCPGINGVCPGTNGSCEPGTNDTCSNPGLGCRVGCGAPSTINCPDIMSL